MMYSTSGERLVVAVSNLGAGYVPAGVMAPGFCADAVVRPHRQHLPSAVGRVAGSGRDPGGYSELKAAEPAVWRLAAAATTWTEVEALMAAARHMGTEWASCSALTMPNTIEKEAAAKRAEYAHRLACAFPDLHDRVAELRETAATDGPAS